MIRGLIFDFDGLILDTESPEYRSWQEVFRDYGCDLATTRWDGRHNVAPTRVQQRFRTRSADVGGAWEVWEPP